MSTFDTPQQCPICPTKFTKGIGECCSRKCHNQKLANKRNYKDPSYLEKAIKAGKENNRKRFNTNIIQETLICIYCNTIFQAEPRNINNPKSKQRKVCSKKCGAMHNGKTGRDKIIKLAKEDPNWGFKNKEHQKRAAELAMQSPNVDKRRSSKPERALRAALKEIDTNWKAHRIIEHKAVDLINHNLRIIVEYDGPSHFRNIWDKLEEQQRKDKETIKWSELNGYKLYRISDSYFVNKLSKNTNLIVKDIYQFLTITESKRFRYLGNETSW